MPSASKSSQTTKNVLLALALIWSVVSLIIIVVWATSPDMKSSAKCRAELQKMTENLEATQQSWRKDKVALEEQVEEGRAELAREKASYQLLQALLNTTNTTLEECRQENLLLNRNISTLQEEVEQLHQTEANLTARLRLQEDHIEVLQQNLTQAFHQTESCFSLKEAAQSQMLAAQSQTKACQSSQHYLQKQLQKCKLVESEATEQTQCTSAALPLTGVSALMLLICSSLHLIT
ncbi:hypothetical protein PAMA_001335 [Pampus argenteus]